MPLAARSSLLDSTWLVVEGGPTTVSTAPRFAAKCETTHLLARGPPADLTSRSARATRNIREREKGMAGSRNTENQNVTISLSRNVLKKAKILAARRETSISRLLARELESLVGDEEAYERAERQALALLDKGFHLGGEIRAGRDEWHER